MLWTAEVKSSKNIIMSGVAIFWPSTQFLRFQSYLEDILNKTKLKSVGYKY